MTRTSSTQSFFMEISTAFQWSDDPSQWLCNNSSKANCCHSAIGQFWIATMSWSYNDWDHEASVVPWLPADIPDQHLDDSPSNQLQWWSFFFALLCYWLWLLWTSRGWVVGIQNKKSAQQNGKAAICWQTRSWGMSSQFKPFSSQNNLPP